MGLWRYEFCSWIVEQNMYRKKKISSTMEVNDRDPLLGDLNPQQKRAVTCSINQSTLVLSGAGLFSFVRFLLFFKFFSFPDKQVVEKLVC